VASCRQLTQQGTSAIDRGDWKRAEGLLARAVQSSGNDADARRYYAEALWRRGARTEALVQMQQARRLAGEDPNLAVRTGELHLELSDTQSASQMVNEALRMDPKLANAWALRGRVSAAGGQHRAALADYQRALGYAPGDRDVGILIAEAYRQLNEPERALVSLQTLAESYSPGDEPQRLLLLQGLALSALQRYDEASRVLSAAAYRDRPTSEILYYLADAEWRGGRVASAQKTLDQCLALDPEHAPSRTLRAQIGTVAAATAQAIAR
jgi:tetratricopeptide (TPR) repeat protein